MGSMADGIPTDELWHWCVTGCHLPVDVRRAVADVLGRPVVDLLSPPTGDEVLCDVWHVGGDYPTLIDVYLAPGDRPERVVAGAVAVRLGADLLLPDDSLNPTRYVRAGSDGTLSRVHVDELETDDGPERRHTRPCTGSDPACAIAPEQDAA